MRTSTSRPFILDPFINLQAFSALSGESNLTVPQPFDFPFSILISANITCPAVSENEEEDEFRGRHGEISAVSTRVLHRISDIYRRHTTVTELFFQLLPREIVGKLQHETNAFGTWKSYQVRYTIENTEYLQHCHFAKTYIPHKDLTACFGTRASVRHVPTHVSVTTKAAVHVHSRHSHTVEAGAHSIHWHVTHPTTCNTG